MNGGHRSGGRTDHFPAGQNPADTANPGPTGMFVPGIRGHRTGIVAERPSPTTLQE